MEVKRYAGVIPLLSITIMTTTQKGTTPPVSKMTNFKLRYLVRRMVCEKVFGPNLLAFITFICQNFQYNLKLQAKYFTSTLNIFQVSQFRLIISRSLGQPILVEIIELHKISHSCCSFLLQLLREYRPTSYRAM